MERFVGRARELKYLEKMWSDERYKTCAIYGRRRIGKTRMIQEFIRDKKSIVFDLVLGTEPEIIRRMDATLRDITGISTPSDDLFDILKNLKQICSEEKTVIVIDELPYLTANNDRAASELQHFTDWLVDNTDSMLIVSGSSISLMRDELKNRNSPLYQRFFFEIDLKPLSLEEVREFHPGMSDTDILKTYLILGGIPLYHAGAGNRNYVEIVEDYLFEPTNLFYNDPTAIVVGELKDQAENALSVLQAIASGSTRFSEIASHTGLSDYTVDRCLDELKGMRLVDTLHPMADAPKQPVYIITDAPTSFYFNVIGRHPQLSRYSSHIFESASDPISVFLGRQFEIFCRNLLPKVYPCSEIGCWWGKVPVRGDDGRITRDANGKVLTEGVDIDIIATLRRKNERIDLFAECKFINRKMSLSMLKTLQERVSSLKGGYNERLALISVKGFDDELQYYAEDNGIFLIDLDTIMGKKDYPTII